MNSSLKRADYRWPDCGKREYRWAEAGKWNIKRAEFMKHFVPITEPYIDFSGGEFGRYVGVSFYKPSGQSLWRHR